MSRFELARRELELDLVLVLSAASSEVDLHKLPSGVKLALGEIGEFAEHLLREDKASVTALE